MKSIIKILIITSIFGLIITILINTYILNLTKNKIENIDTEEIDCILVLGAGIKNNRPSPMLEDRLITSIKLYNKNISDKIIVSGDHGKTSYDEVNVMKEYLVEHNIPSNNIFMDHAGFSTYDSIYRTKEIFQAKKIIIVTQEYHLYRALYIAEKLGIEAYGVSADIQKYMYQTKRDIREVVARVKDFVKVIIKPEPKYLGEIIPIDSDGDLTNDK